MSRLVFYSTTNGLMMSLGRASMSLVARGPELLSLVGELARNQGPLAALLRSECTRLAAVGGGPNLVNYGSSASYQFAALAGPVVPRK